MGNIYISIKNKLASNYNNISCSIDFAKRKLRPPSIPENPRGKVYIHLGCGKVNAPGFINVDAIPFSHVHYVQEIDDWDAFPKKYADLIYACHVLEHISHKDLKRVLSGWNKILKNDGIFRISVPDFDRIIDIYIKEGKSIEAIISPLMGGQEYKYNYHYSTFNKCYLEKILLDSGFKRTQEWEPLDDPLHQFEDWAIKDIVIDKKFYPISINIEAIK